MKAYSTSFDSSFTVLNTLDRAAAAYQEVSLSCAVFGGDLLRGKLEFVVRDEHVDRQSAGRE